MARERPKASNVIPPGLTVLDGGRPDTDGPPLTRGESRELRHLAPLTHAQRREHLRAVPDPPDRRD